VAENGKGARTPRAAEDVLRFAIAREDEAARLYDDLIERSASGEARTLFRELHAEELRHKSLLEKIVVGQGQLTPSRPVPDLKISDYLVAEPLSAGSRFQEILIFAAKKEALAAALYTALLDRAEDPEHRHLFEFLIKQEKRHKLRLEQEYERHVLEED
jgi:rubrerythrin